LTYEDLINECQLLRQRLDDYRISNNESEVIQANLNSLINNQETSIWSIDRDYRYVIFNDFFKTEYLSAFGIELKKGLHVLDILTPELAAFWKEKYDRALNGEQFSFEFTHQIKEQTCTFKVSLNPVVSNNKISGVSALSVDVTDQKQIESILKESNSNMSAIMENTLESIWAINTSYEILYTNSVFQREFFQGFGVELKKGINLLKSLPEPIQPLWKSRYDRALSGERFSFVDEIDVGARVYYVEVSMNPILDKDEVVGASFFANDISERIIAEKALQDSESRLKKLNLTKDKFFSIIAHDLRSPFNSIIGLSELLSERIKNKNYSDIEQIANIIKNSSIQTNNLLSNLLEWSRSQSNGIEFKPEYFNLNPFIKNEVEAITSLANQKSITLTNHTPNTLVFADKYMLSTCLRNLLSNAIKFTNTEGSVRIESKQLANNQISICVEDNGIGILESDIEKLFVIDQNLTTYGTSDEKGSGLGLILCKEFVDKHNGTIKVESKIDKGSKFTIILPGAII